MGMNGILADNNYDGVDGDDRIHYRIDFGRIVIFVWLYMLLYLIGNECLIDLKWIDDIYRFEFCFLVSLNGTSLSKLS